MPHPYLHQYQTEVAFCYRPSTCSLLRRNSYCIRSEFSTSDKHLFKHLITESVAPVG